MANVYSTYMAPAFIGMKADSMEDNVDTFPASATIPLGVAVKRTGSGAVTIEKGASATLGVGVSLHDHVIGYVGSYRQYDAVSVLTRGRAWVKVADATGVADGVQAKALPTTGEFQTTGTVAVAVTNCVFRSAAQALLNVDGTTTTLGAVVEMHNPNI